MIESSVECIEKIAAVLESAEEDLLDIISQTPEEYKQRVEEVIMETLSKRVNAYHGKKPFIHLIT